MQKKLLQRITLLLLVTLLIILLCGCDIPNILGNGGKGNASVTLHGTVNCYAEPDTEAQITATIEDGLQMEYNEEDVVTIKSVQWLKIKQGWIMLTPMDVPKDVPEDLPAQTIVQMEGFVTVKLLKVHAEPGETSDQIDHLPGGTKVFVSAITELGDEQWGKTEQGWIYMGYVYIPGERGEHPGYAVVRENGAKIYTSILNANAAVKELEVGDRVTVLEQVETENGDLWVYAEGGWISEKDIYIEGTEGKRPCTGIVDDTTPLNVRFGPGTDYAINTSLPDGTYVRVLERITCKKHDWGFVGDGWIYMDNVDIHGT